MPKNFNQFFGMFQHWSKRHLQRYVAEFVGRHNQRGLSILDRMTTMVRGMKGKRLTLQDLRAG